MLRILNVYRSCCALHYQRVSCTRRDNCFDLALHFFGRSWRLSLRNSTCSTALGASLSRLSLPLLILLIIILEGERLHRLCLLVIAVLTFFRDRIFILERTCWWVILRLWATCVTLVRNGLPVHLMVDFTDLLRIGIPMLVWRTCRHLNRPLRLDINLFGLLHHHLLLSNWVTRWSLVLLSPCARHWFALLISYLLLCEHHLLPLFSSNLLVCRNALHLVVLMQAKTRLLVMN